MNASRQIDSPLDEIRTFLPEISEPEYALRRRVRSARNIAVLAVNNARPGIARNLFILLRDHGDDWVYRPASLEVLERVVAQCMRLFQAAQAAEALEGVGGR